MSATAIACAAGGVGTVAVAGLAYATVAPASSFWGPVVARGPEGSGRVALTFDDGPTSGSTDRVLDILDQAAVKATFFIVGVNAQQRPELLHRIYDSGHLIANHTLNHSHYTVFRRLRYWRDQIRATDDVVESIVGVRPAIFRPPMGVKTWHTARAVRELGHTLVTWSRRAMDGFPTSSDRILNRFSDSQAGDILLLHDGVEPHSSHRDRSATVNALQPLIDRLRSRNLTSVRLDQLIALTPYQSQSRAATAT
jgi:peptidoglycan/xylan/chitin deacetylase (PgdA/CDA1 family)